MYSYALLRITLGINLLIHGLVRFGNYFVFIETMEKNFKKTFLPQIILDSFVWILPPFEALIGLFLILGLMTRVSVILGAALLMILIFGTGLLQDWSTMSFQMIYATIYFILLFHICYNKYSVDEVIKSDTYNKDNQ